ncbi:13893_t:CDS:2 [Funneliformis geosporum]|uniref:cytochrome-b5 reductase n=1 Tax=Funneliformis geosporum TaxID=1117311 RepID=A0A9W4SR16_9GLOM|nr:13893_t:CDS:2 [Funneliformis geosporum]CAI2178483.1 18225_t:CDS:2 [Funneliformis geosporum]
MTEPKPTSSNAGEDVLQFLETLDTYSQTADASNPTTESQVTDTQSVLDFIDQFSKNQNNSSKGDSQSNVSISQENSVEQPKSSSQPSEISDGNQEIKQSGTWSWGGLIASASTAYKTASTVVDTSVKGALATVETVRTNEGTKKIEEKFRGILNKEAIGKIGYDLRTLGLNTLTTVVNAVVPPISQYEIVEVWLTHDMVGYVGIESLVYRSFMKVMEQVEGGDIKVRKANESIKSDSEDDSCRDLNICEGFIEAVGIAKANIEQSIKKHYKPPPSISEKMDQRELLRDIPTTTCPVFMAIQPTKANPYSLPTNNEITMDSENYLYYVIVLTDPTHNLNFKTISQALPASWIDIPYEENEWVEAKMVSTIKLAVQIIAQEYVWHLSEITPVNHNTRVFRLKFPSALKEPIPIASCIHVKDDSTQIMREYTPISPINELNFLDLLIKRYDNGHMSRLIHNLKIGDKFEARGPIVTLPYAPNMKKHIGMICGGTGITPMYQLINYILQNPDDRTKIYLIYANITKEDILLYNDFKELSKNHPKQLKIYYTLDKPPKDEFWTQGVGYVSEEMVKENIPAPNEDVLVLVCGPSGMMRKVSGEKASNMSQGLVGGILKKLGYTQEQVFKF